LSALTPDHIRAARAQKPRLYARDFAEDIGITEAQLCAAFVGTSATRISADPNAIMPLLAALGQVMALTRNDSCVLEKVGSYDHFQPGTEEARLVNPPIELRLFPARWAYAFALDEAGPKGPKRSIQIFDAAGEAVHKIHLREETNAAAWPAIVAALRLDDQAQTLDLAPVSAADGWARVNELSAYRSGTDGARRLPKGSVERLMYRAAEVAVPVSFMVGNPGCVEIHAGPIVRVLEAGPWINVLDPGLELHLRMDHIAETWARSDSSVDTFDASGRLITRFSGAEGWADLLAEQPGFEAE